MHGGPLIFQFPGEALDRIDLGDFLPHSGRWMRDAALAFLIADANPEAGSFQGGSSEILPEPFLVPPRGRRLGNDAGKEVRPGEAQMNRGEAAEAEAANEVAAVGDLRFLNLSPADDILRDEPA